MKEYIGKVLIITQNLPVPFIRRVWLEAKTLKKHGIKVSVICPKSEEYPLSYEQIDGIGIYRYKMPIEAEGVLSYLFEFAYGWLATALLSIKVLIREGFDVIQACNPPDTCFLYGMIYKLFGKEFIFDHHDLSPEMFLAKYHKSNPLLYRGLLLLEKLTMRTARIIISTNESYRQIAIKRGKMDPEDVYALRTGPDLNHLRIKPAEPELKLGRKYMICYLGEMCPQDGIDYLLRSADYLINGIGRKDVLFTLIGGGPSMKKFKAMSENMGLSEYVHFTGRIPDEDVCRYLSTADVCVDPDPWSEWANNSTMNKMLEYMTFGKPIVAFDLKEGKISAGEAAVYVQPNDFKKFSEELDGLLDAPELRREMGEYGLTRVREKLAWCHTYRPLLAAYSKVFNVLLERRKKRSTKSLRFKPVLQMPLVGQYGPCHGSNGRSHKTPVLNEKWKDKEVLEKLQAEISMD